MFRHVYFYMFGPNLYGLYRSLNQSNQSGCYSSSILERVSSFTLDGLNRIGGLFFYLSPITLSYLFFNQSALSHWSRVQYGVLCVGFIYITCLVFRTIFRATNRQYRHFVSALCACRYLTDTEQKRCRLRPFDFDMRHWPINYRAQWPVMTSQSGFGTNRYQMQAGSESRAYTLVTLLMMKLFGLRLMYPGYTSMLNFLLDGFLLEGRFKLVDKYSAIRYRLLTVEGDTIDTMFVDRRNCSSEQQQRRCGRKLVITCEGNAGYYEIGCMHVPLDCGYSVLGWNHPGFQGSSGTPYPHNERAAISAVLEFAIQRLGFDPEDIILYAWSIGGYVACWAASSVTHEGVHVPYLILDATFDDVVPLAITRMPQCLSHIVQYACRKHANIVPAAHITQFPGAVRFIRRTQDEIISTRDADIRSNRGNHIFLDFMSARYAKLIDEQSLEALTCWLNAEPLRRQDVGVDNDEEDDELNLSQKFHKILNTINTEDVSVTEISSAQKSILLLHLASKHLDDFDATHCIPLPSSKFVEPWVPKSDNLNIDALL